jgi:hypothetical protein
MKIACLGWGSLIWETRELPISGEWKSNGPMIPVEFARQSQDGRITLVIVPGVKPIQSFRAYLSSGNLSEAREALRVREDIPLKNLDVHIASVKRGDNNFKNDINKSIYSWMEPLDLDAVVWTALPPKFNGKNDFVPTKEQLLDYLSSLDDETKKAAENYIRKTHPQIETEYRGYIESNLGWTIV